MQTAPLNVVSRYLLYDLSGCENTQKAPFTHRKCPGKTSLKKSQTVGSSSIGLTRKPFAGIP